MGLITADESWEQSFFVVYCSFKDRSFHGLVITEFTKAIVPALMTSKNILHIFIDPEARDSDHDN